MPILRRVEIAKNTPIREGKHQLMLFAHGKSGFRRDHQCFARLRLALDVFMFNRVHDDRLIDTDLQRLHRDGVTKRWTMTMETAPSGTLCPMSLIPGIS